ncbi:SDR family oxidoreductase [Gryllotalpicola protaetiae]|uniref:SDR family NAD(P)-dependent oxidoreductase n=1 Tax=Gryllotalpicola protaetiae TaxID=2419771 RepID=A0A387BJ98_9MICO|nr:SDR family oxidoreductase [Gryllotalpicola protaetiae]AYG03903.1 SDR family NAD(P)-dependent oxidoreductase [Gryllotalpicola protaetiae]
MNIENSVVLITGANGGLGAEFVEQALSRGAQRVYASARTPRPWSSGRVVPLSLDVTSQESIDKAAAIATDVDIVINNAGRNTRQGLLDSELETTRAIFETNVFGQIAVTKAFAPALAAHGGGALVNVLSVMSWVPRRGAYNPSKAAFWSVTNSLRLELAAQNTQVVGAHLSFTDTPMTADLTVPKATAADIVRAIYDGVQNGEIEVLADEPSRNVKALLAGDVRNLEGALFT